jgi:uncharacterized cupin superfamily protein
MKSPVIVDFRHGTAATEGAIEAGKLLAGSPQTTLANHYSDASLRFHCGTWGSTPGRWRVSYTEHEFCYLLEGRVRLTADDGTIAEFRAGDAFVVPAGFSGTWETLETTRKHYAIFEGAAQGSGSAG